MSNTDMPLYHVTMLTHPDIRIHASSTPDALKRAAGIWRISYAEAFKWATVARILDNPSVSATNIVGGKT